jgi:hypothetical protein
VWPGLTPQQFDNQSYEIRKELVWVLSNVTSGGTPEQLECGPLRVWLCAG